MRSISRLVFEQVQQQLCCIPVESVVRKFQQSSERCSLIYFNSGVPDFNDDDHR